MSGKSVQNRSSLSFTVADGMLDMDHIMQVNPWKEAEKFNKSEMGHIQNVLNEFNNMVLERKRSPRSSENKRKEKKKNGPGKENDSVSSKSKIQKDEQKSSKMVNSRTTRKTSVHKTNCTQAGDTDVVQGSEKPSRIPRLKKKADAKTKKTIQADKHTRDGKKDAKKTARKSSNQTQLPQGKNKTSSDFQEMPERNDSQEPNEMSKKTEEDHPQNFSSVENKTRRIKKRKLSTIYEKKTINVKREQFDVMERSNCDMTFDTDAVANSTMSGHASVNVMTATDTSNAISNSCVRKPEKGRTYVIETAAVSRNAPPKMPQIKQEKGSPITENIEMATKNFKTQKRDENFEALTTKKIGSVKNPSKEALKKTSENKLRTKTPRGKFDQPKRRGSLEEQAGLVKRYGKQAARAIEKFSHYVVSMTKEMGSVKGVESSDCDSSCSDSYDGSGLSESSYSTHSEFCTCGECTSCSSDEFSEYTVCSCSNCDTSFFSDCAESDDL